MTAEAKELKPCPFCNGKDDLQITEIPSRDGTIVWVSIHHGPSGECSIKMIADSEEKVIQLWNRRDYTFAIAEKAVGEEPELPGDMPDEMWEAIKSDRQVMRESFRIAVRQTKHGILSRIKTEIGSE